MNNNRKTLLLTLGATFVLMAMLVAYTSRLMYTSSHSYIDELGNDKARIIWRLRDQYSGLLLIPLTTWSQTAPHMTR